MFNQLRKYFYMVKIGYKYIDIFKKTFFNPFITLRQGYKQLSINRQNYSNAMLKNLNVEVKVIGELPTRDKILYTINHRSLLDIIVMEHIFAIKEKNGAWIAKEELFTAVYGDFFKYSGCISVDLENKKGLLKFFKTIKKTLTTIDDFNIYMFPEGERNKELELKEFQSGASKIARANKLDVVPVYINDTLESVFKNAPYEETKVVEVHIGTIIDAKNIEKDYSDFMNKAKKGNIDE